VILDWERPTKKRRSKAAPLIIALLVPVVVIVLLFHRLALALDRILFPHLREMTVRKPIFVVGLPRSGTTFTHRLLASHQSCFTTMPLWELVLAPALCQKYLLLGLKRCDKLIGAPLHRAVSWLEARLTAGIGEVHPTGLADPEEDYLALLPYDGCFLRVLVLPYAKSTWELAWFTSLPAAKQRRLLKAYRGILQRHLAFRGQDLRFLSKNPSFTNWVSALSEEFPDACFVGLHRDLEQVIPSQLSSIRAGLALFGNSAHDPWLGQQFVGLLKQYQAKLCSDAVGLGHGMLLLDYRMISESPREALVAIHRRFDLPDRDYEDSTRLNQLLMASRAYTSKHRYSLEEFGLQKSDLAGGALESLARSPSDPTRSHSRRTKSPLSPSEDTSRSEAAIQRSTSCL